MTAGRNKVPIERGRAGLFFLLFAVLLGAGAYSAYFIRQIYGEKEIEIQRLNEVVARLEAGTRVAQVIVTDQGKNTATGALETTIKFLEIDRKGKSLPPHYFTVKGDVIYFDALVIKFDHNYIERGEALRGKSICLFRRIFGEFQSPDEGYPVDGEADQGVPSVYRVDDQPSSFETELWKDFWRYAADRSEAEKKGIRVIQGEAVYTRFLKRNVYTITLDHSGGINILVEPIPRILQDEL